MKQTLHKYLSKPQAFSVILACGILMRVLWLLFIANKPLMSDAASYNTMSNHLLSGEAFVPYWPPGLPLYLALVHKLFGPAAIAVRFAMLLFYVGASVFVHRTATLFTGSMASGNLALTLLAVSPASIHASVEPLTQLPAAMLITVIAYCLVRLECGPFAWCGPVLAISGAYLALIRPSSLLLLAGLPLYLLWRTRKWVAPLALTAIAGALVVSWIGYVYERTGQLVKINTANSANFYLGNNPYTPVYRTWWLGSHHNPPEVPLEFAQQRARIMQLDTAAQETELSALAKNHIRQRPDLFLLRSFNRVCTYFAFDTFAGAYVIGNYGVPSLVGLVVIAADAILYFLMAVGSIFYFVLPLPERLRRQACLLLGIVVLYATPYFFAFSHPSYRFPIEPLLIILSSAFFTLLLDEKGLSIREVMAHRPVPVAIVLVLFSLIQVEFLSIVMLHRS